MIDVPAGGRVLSCFQTRAASALTQSHVRERLAVLGLVVLVADLYGDGATARDIPHARELMGQLRSDLARWRARAEAARLALTQQGNVDAARIAAIGYCFGGTTALELARSGAALSAVISFHGGLANARPEDAGNIKAKVLVCHGAADALGADDATGRFPGGNEPHQRGLAGLTFMPARSTVSPTRTPTMPEYRNSAMTWPQTGDHGRPMLGLFEEVFGAIA